MLPIIASLISAGLPMIAGAVMGIGEKAVKDKLGVDLSEYVGTEEGRLKLKQMEIDHDEFLAKAVMENKQLDLQEFGMELADTASARDREVKIATSADAPWLSKVIVPMLAIGILALTFVMFYVILFSNAPIDPSRKEVMIYILGVLSAIDTQVVGYYFGSSKGSAMKDETINKLQGVKA